MDIYLLLCYSVYIKISINQNFFEVKYMKAKFEQNTLSGSIQTSAHKYKNLHNLPHWHLEYEIVYIFKGFAEIMINNNFFKIPSGACIFIDSQDIHYIKGSENSIIGVIKTNASDIKRIVENKALSTPVVHIDYAENAFLEILAEIKNNKAYCGIITECIVAKLVAHIFRNSITIEKKTENNKYKDLLEMILNNFSHITFEEAAEYMNLNKSYFSRYFYSFSGMTFTQYINTLKVAFAIEKILEKKLSVTDISIACGFGTIRNFNRVFKQFTGYSPKKLPDNYVFVYNFKELGQSSFDPTLNCTELIQ